MKLRKKIAIVGVAVSIITGGALLAYSPSGTTTAEIARTTPVSKVAEIEPKKVEPKTKPEPVLEQEEVVEAAPKRVVAEKPAEPKVLSTQEYANKYLSFSTPPQQECFDAIVAEWPERFVPSVREQNVKALRAWASICASGIKTSFTAPTTVGHIYLYGEDGGFFDSPLAKAYQ